MSDSSSNSGGAPAAPASAPSTADAPARPAPLDQSPKLQGGLSAEEAVRRLTESRSGTPRPPPRREPRAEAAPAADAGGDPIDSLINAFRQGGGTPAPAAPAPGANGHDAAPQEGPIRLTIDGRTQDFSPDQLVSELHKASDYTRKSQQLAELNRQITERAEMIDRMLPVLVPEIERQIAALDAQLGQPIDWDTLARNDPAEYVRQDALWKKAAAERERMQQLTALQQEESRAQNERRLSEGHAQLAKALPGWDNPATRGKLQSDLIRWGRQAGFSDGELSGIYEPRHITTLFKAMAFDRLMGGVKSDAPPVPNVQRRGTPPPPARERATSDVEKRFSESHSMRDAVSVLNARRRVH